MRQKIEDQIEQEGHDMTDQHAIKVLIEFFREEFKQDPMATSEWLAQGGDDPQEFLAAIERLQQQEE
jgi:hypothetical protein